MHSISNVIVLTYICLILSGLPLVAHVLIIVILIFPFQKCVPNVRILKAGHNLFTKTISVLSSNTYMFCYAIGLYPRIQFRLACTPGQFFVDAKLFIGTP